MKTQSVFNMRSPPIPTVSNSKNLGVVFDNGLKLAKQAGLELKGSRKYYLFRLNPLIADTFTFCGTQNIFSCPQNPTTLRSLDLNVATQHNILPHFIYTRSYLFFK